MTIDAIIARMTFDAVTQDKDFQVATTKAIEMLAKHKDGCKNDFDVFLASFTTDINNEIKNYNEIFDKLCDTNYALFYDVIKLNRIALSARGKIDGPTYFITQFLQNNKDNTEIYTDAADAFVKNQMKIIDFVEETIRDFSQINLDLSDAVGAVNTKETKNIIVLANINRFLIDSKDKPEYLRRQLDEKIGELKIPNEVLLAHDFAYLCDFAEKEADNMRACRLIGYSASEYVDTVHTYIAIQHNALMSKVTPNKPADKKEAIDLIIKRSRASDSLQMVLKQNQYSFDGKIYESAPQKTM